MRTRFTLLIALASVTPGIRAQSPDAPKGTPPPQVKYASPQAVFEAYRQALAKGDVRTQMSCMVREIREDAYQHFIEGSFAMECSPPGSPMKQKIAAVFKKFGVDSVEPEYRKQLQAKYGNDGRRQSDEAMLRKIVNEKVANKFEFGIAIAEAAKQPTDEQQKHGPLKNVQVQGDKATGTAAAPVESWYAAPSQPSQKVVTYVDSSFQFRKTNDGWLIAVFGDDDQSPPRPDPQAIPAPPVAPSKPVRPR